MFMLFKKCFRKHKLFVQMDTKSLDNTYDKHVAYLKKLCSSVYLKLILLKRRFIYIVYVKN